MCILKHVENSFIYIINSMQDANNKDKYRALSGTSHGPRKATIIGNAVTTLKILQSAIQYAIHGRRPAAAAK